MLALICFDGLSGNAKVYEERSIAIPVLGSSFSIWLALIWLLASPSVRIVALFRLPDDFAIIFQRTQTGGGVGAPCYLLP